MNNILLFVMVLLVIVLFFENMKQKTSERFVDTPIENIKDIELPTIKTVNACPLRENDIKTDYYLDKMKGTTIRCPKPTQTIKEFNKKFFDFRDHTYHNSSITLDPVDKVINMQLDGDLGQVGGKDNRKIKDIFDELTNGVDLYSKKCVRLPYYDNTMHNGYIPNSVTGMHNTRDNWIYNNEKEMNGGQVDANLYGNDPMDLHQFPSLV